MDSRFGDHLGVRRCERRSMPAKGNNAVAEAAPAPSGKFGFHGFYGFPCGVLKAKNDRPRVPIHISRVSGIDLPSEIDSAKAAATRKNGVLEINIPKTGKALTKRVEVKTL
jgi:hypothetical protein